MKSEQKILNTMSGAKMFDHAPEVVKPDVVMLLSVQLKHGFVFPKVLNQISDLNEEFSHFSWEKKLSENKVYTQ